MFVDPFTKYPIPIFKQEGHSTPSNTDYSSKYSNFETIEGESSTVSKIQTQSKEALAENTVSNCKELESTKGKIRNILNPVSDEPKNFSLKNLVQQIQGSIDALFSYLPKYKLQ